MHEKTSGKNTEQWYAVRGCQRRLDSSGHPISDLTVGQNAKNDFDIDYYSTTLRWKAGNNLHFDAYTDIFLNEHTKGEMYD